jgi:hypothetical protein
MRDRDTILTSYVPEGQRAVVEAVPGAWVLRIGMMDNFGSYWVARNR